MSQNVERAKAIKLARKLMDQTTTRGRTEGEMNQAMDQLDKIKATFNLTLDEIVLNSLEYKKVTVEGTAPKGDPMSNVLFTIAEFTDTKRWRTKHGAKMINGVTPRRWSSKKGHYTGGRRCTKVVYVGNPKYHFFGLESDVQMAEFMYELVSHSLDKAAAEFAASDAYQNITRRGGKRSAMYTFKQSFTQTLSYRLAELTMGRRREERATHPNANELTFSKESVREQKFKDQLGITLVSTRSAATGGRSSVGGQAGHASANSVNLSRPVNAPNSNRVLQLT